MNGARLLLETTGAKNPPAPPKKKRCGFTLAQQLAMEPQWEDPVEGDGDINAPAFDSAA
jgi:hypothetical protein